jgi:UDPglucose 6-dehydrogenase
MSVESAEMSKHALNAFLAMSVSFANEIAAICEQVGADAKEVERALKSEQRIGPGAYLAAGAAFAGGTLARDVQYLRELAREHDQPCNLVAAIKDSNDAHKNWTRRKLMRRFGELRGKRLAVLGLTYKPGTDTLRRSLAVELCQYLVAQGAEVVAHDPRVRTLPSEFGRDVRVEASPLAAMDGANAVIVGTSWPEFREITAAEVRRSMAHPVIIDPNGFLAKVLHCEGIEYHAVGAPYRAVVAASPEVT